MGVINSFTVSVCIITYNHEHYIRQTIESVLSQITTFPFEIVIGEDSSIDRTRNICVEYRERYPGIITLLGTNSNIGMSKNFAKTIYNCHGKYLSFCEGDDYWTDHDKLQKQVDFLETKREFSLCFHNAQVMELNGQIIRNFYLNNSNGIFTYHDILEKDSFPLLSSILIRNDRSMLRPFFKGELKARDIILILIVLEKGNAYYMNDVMSCRRIQNTGVWASLDGYEKLKVQINIRKEYLKYYKNHYYSSSLSKNLINKLFLLNKLLLKKRKAFKLISNSLAIFYYSIRFRQIKFSVRKTLYAIIK